MKKPLLFRAFSWAAACVLLALAVLIPAPGSVVRAASAISLRSTATGNNAAGSTTLVLAAPSGVRLGDVLLAQVVVNAISTVITPPSGWHLIRTVQSGLAVQQSTFYKAAAGSEPAAYTWTFSASQPATGAINSFIGVNSTNPVDVSSGKYNGLTATASFTQLTTSVPNDLLLALVAVDGSTTVSPPSGYSEDYEASDAGFTHGKTAEMSQLPKGSAGLTAVGDAREDTLAATNLTQLIALRPAADIVLAVVGDMHCETPTCQDAHTADLVSQIKPNAVLQLGDLVDSGAYSNFVNYYDPLWGPFRSIARPEIGNHEGVGTGYYDYWNGIGVTTGRAGTRGKGWYSFNIGSWHFVALNSNCVSDSLRVSCQPGSEQINWLSNDLSTNSALCTIAFMHHPYYTSGTREYPELQTIFQMLYDHRVELYFAGHTHYYQRFYPQDASSDRVDTNGVTEIAVGTGGGTLALVNNTPTARNEAAQIGQTFGVLKLVLHAGSYSYQFLPAAGFTGTDSGSGTCH